MDQEIDASFDVLFLSKRTLTKMAREPRELGF